MSLIDDGWLVTLTDAGVEVDVRADGTLVLTGEHDVPQGDPWYGTPSETFYVHIKRDEWEALVAHVATRQIDQPPTNPPTTPPSPRS